MGVLDYCCNEVPTLRSASLQIAAGKKRKAEEAEARARAEEERAAAEDAEDRAAAEQRAKELRNDVAYHLEGPGSLSTLSPWRLTKISAAIPC